MKDLFDYIDSQETTFNDEVGSLALFFGPLIDTILLHLPKYLN